MAGTPTFVNVLRIWLSFVAIITIGNTIQCFTSPSYLFDRLYTVDEKNAYYRSTAWSKLWFAARVTAISRTVVLSSNFLMETLKVIYCFLPQIETFLVRYLSGLTARLFGVWTLLAGGLRLMCALDIYNTALYHVTFFSFLLALCHFLSEVCFYGTAALTAGILAPFIVGSVSALLMLVGYITISPEDPRANFENENEQILKSKPKKTV